MTVYGSTSYRSDVRPRTDLGQPAQGQRRRAPVGVTAPARPPARDTFRPDIEGLRAVAVLVVVLYHAGVTALGGGYVGVDVFFVISGFLITTNLYRELDRTCRLSLCRLSGRRVK